MSIKKNSKIKNDELESNDTNAFYIPSGGLRYLKSTICSICSNAIASSRMLLFGVFSSVLLTEN